MRSQGAFSYACVRVIISLSPSRPMSGRLFGGGVGLRPSNVRTKRRPAVSIEFAIGEAGIFPILLPEILAVALYVRFQEKGGAICTIANLYSHEARNVGEIMGGAIAVAIWPAVMALTTLSETVRPLILCKRHIYGAFCVL